MLSIFLTCGGKKSNMNIEPAARQHSIQIDLSRLNTIYTDIDTAIFSKIYPSILNNNIIWVNAGYLLETNNTLAVLFMCVLKLRLHWEPNIACNTTL